MVKKSNAFTFVCSECYRNNFDLMSSKTYAGCCTHKLVNLLLYLKTLEEFPMHTLLVDIEVYNKCNKEVAELTVHGADYVKNKKDVMNFLERFIEIDDNVKLEIFEMEISTMASNIRFEALSDALLEKGISGFYGDWMARTRNDIYEVGKTFDAILDSAIKQKENDNYDKEK